MRHIGKIEQFVATIILTVIFVLIWKSLGIEVVICFALANIIIEQTTINNNGTNKT